MKFRLAPASAVPIYRQLVDQVAYQLAAGQLRPGDKLPSVRELARDLPANQNTVIKAYELLERDGLIERRHGDGTYVSSNGSPIKLAERRRIVRERIADAAAHAQLLGLDADELRGLLDEEIDRLTQSKWGDA